MQDQVSFGKQVPRGFYDSANRVTRILSTLLIAGLCSAPLMRAQQTNPATPQQAPETQPAAATASHDAASASNPARAQPIRRSLPMTRHGNGPGTEHAAHRAGKSESAAAADIAGDQRESVASAAAACHDVSRRFRRRSSNHRRTPRAQTTTTIPEASTAQDSQLSLWAPRRQKAFRHPAARRPNPQALPLLRPSSTRHAHCCSRLARLRPQARLWARSLRSATAPRQRLRARALAGVTGR